MLRQTTSKYPAWYYRILRRCGADLGKLHDIGATESWCYPSYMDPWSWRSAFTSNQAAVQMFNLSLRVILLAPFWSHMVPSLYAGDWQPDRWDAVFRENGDFDWAGRSPPQREGQWASTCATHIFASQFYDTCVILFWAMWRERERGDRFQNCSPFCCKPQAEVLTCEQISWWVRLPTLLFETAKLEGTEFSKVCPHRLQGML